MPHVFQPIRYGDLNARQKENYNFQKVSAVLADFGFTAIRLSDDWHGADFIAAHLDGKTFLKVQLKARLLFDRKYVKRDIHICFPYENQWYIYPHDELLDEFKNMNMIFGTNSWDINGLYHFPSLSAKIKEVLKPHRLKS